MEKEKDELKEQISVKDNELEVSSCRILKMKSSL